jgi:hypothetical protein
LELLRDENHPLVIHISFNSTTAFNSDFESKNIELAVIRRILATCLNISWEEATSISLGDSLTLINCISAILAYHKKVHGMSNDQKLFIYLGIDEINKLIMFITNVYDGVKKPDYSMLKKLTNAVRVLDLRSGFVSTLFAGTHYADTNTSFLGTGIKPLNITLARLPEEDLESMLVKDAGLSKRYIEHPNFQKLLEGIRPSMRAIGMAVEKLEYEFNEQSIMDAESVVRNYLNFNSYKILSAKELEVVLGLALTGRRMQASVEICEGSTITIDDLQNLGVVNFIEHPNKDVSVMMSRFTLEAFLSREDCDNRLAASAVTLLSFVDNNGPDSFEKFVAHFHALKKTVFLKSLPADSFHERGVPIKSFYSGAWIGKDLMKLWIQLKPSSFSLNFPDGVMSWNGTRYTDTAEPESVTEHMRNGGVLLNSKGADVDVLASEKVRENSSWEWQDCVIGYGMKHTIAGNTELKLGEINEDYDKAMETLDASKWHSKDKKIMVHFSTRTLAKNFISESDWKTERPRSILVYRDNIDSMVGPMFGGLLTSRGFYLNTVNKHNNKMNRSFSTLAGAVHANRVKKELVGAISRLWRCRLPR